MKGDKYIVRLLTSFEWSKLPDIETQTGREAWLDQDVISFHNKRGWELVWENLLGSIKEDGEIEVEEFLENEVVLFLSQLVDRITEKARGEI